MRRLLTKLLNYIETNKDDNSDLLPFDRIGLCAIITMMWLKQYITVAEKLALQTYVDVNMPRKQTFKIENVITHAYGWPPFKAQPRIDWLKNALNNIDI